MADDSVQSVLVVFGFGFALMLLVNVWALTAWSPESFQRLGSLWVAVLVGIFGFGRTVISGLRAVLKDPSEKSVFLLSGKPNAFLKWAQPSDRSLEALQNPEERNEMEEYLRLVENRMQLKVVPSELFWLCLATLQWGYGDLFHCWINGEGWTTC